MNWIGVALVVAGIVMFLLELKVPSYGTLTVGGVACLVLGAYYRCPNYLIYWKMIEASCERGCTQFDMGRSEAGSSNIKFKMNWGPEPQALPYNYYLVRAKSVPYLDHWNPRYRIPILLWQRLPLFLTRMIGPRMISGLL